MTATANVSFTNFSSSGFRIIVTDPLIDGQEVQKVFFDIWPEVQGQKSEEITVDNIPYQIGESTYQYDVTTSSYKGVTGKYNIVVYCIDNSENIEAVSSYSVIVPAKNQSYSQGSVGYRVLYRTDENDTEPKIIHEPSNVRGNKLIQCQIEKEANTADIATIRIGRDNPWYGKIAYVKGLIEVIDLRDKTTIFNGRVIEIKGNVSVQGSIYQEISCESKLAYLHDSIQTWEKVKNTGPKNILKKIIDSHNNTTEKHKHFKLGTVTVKNQTDKPYLYLTYETSWENIKRVLVEKFGGYIILREEPTGSYIDYLENPGSNRETPIRLGNNIKSAERYISLADMMTRIVPVGADDESYKDDEQIGTSTDIIRPQINISSYNQGEIYLRDPDLEKTFGIITKTVTWSEIDSPAILMRRGVQYLEQQKVALANWKVSVVDRSLIDASYEKFEMFNKHPIINAPLSGIERLQIIALKIDITKPQAIELEIGATNLNFSSYQLQQLNAQKSIEKLNQDLQIQIKQAEEAKAQTEALIQSLSDKLLEQQLLLDQARTSQQTSSEEIAAIQAEIEKLKKQIEQAEGGN